MAQVRGQRFVPGFNVKQVANEDDLYSGYNEYDSAFETKNIENDEFLQEALRTSHGRRTAMVKIHIVPYMSFNVEILICSTKKYCIYNVTFSS